jgi:Rad3-related DNA helicase
MYTILEWGGSPDLDLALAPLNGREIGPIATPATVSDALAAPGLVCFRMEALRALKGDAAGLLVEAALDGVLLARIALPRAESFDIESLQRVMGISPGGADSTSRARSAAELWNALIAKLEAKPWPILDAMLGVLGKGRHPIRPLIESAAREALRTGFGTRERKIRDFFPKADPAWRLQRKEPKDPPERLDIARVCELFAEGQALAQAFGDYERRPEQVRMVREVCEAFNESLVLLVQAGTGTGKSLAYLAPSVLWAVHNDDPVVISTNTKNLQSQLYAKDLPFLERALGGGFRYALIKGRSNYLCGRKLLMALDAPEREFSAEERVALLPLLSWIAETETGDVAELSGLDPAMESAIWPRLSTERDECLGPRCRLSGRCYVRRARMLALQADVVVANHSTVLWETDTAGVALPPYRNIVFDEAHNLESVATDAFSLDAGPNHLPYTLNRLFSGRADRPGRGLLSVLRHHLSRIAAKGAVEACEKVSERITALIAFFKEVREASDRFFLLTGGMLREARFGAERLRYDADHRPDDWPALSMDARDFREIVVQLVTQIDVLQRACEEIAESKEEETEYADLADTGVEIGSQATGLREWVDQLDVLLHAEADNLVFWVQKDPRPGFGRLCAAPLDIAPMMEAKFFSRLRSAVFTSATMATAGDFAFMRDRLGVRGSVTSRVHETDLGTSFDFPRQVLLAVPMYLPEPAGEGGAFVPRFSETAVEVLRASRGRGLVLFTSHAMLRQARTLMLPALEAEGIRVLAQGIDGERSRLISQLHSGRPTVLLGTQSFWEGVDVPGEALSCLILAKLPFRVHTDPIVEARCQRLKAQGRNDFMEYMVPDAALRLMQGFGRLIRTRTDHGVVVLCDPRVMTKRYGQVFRNALPVKVSAFQDKAALTRAVSAFLKAGRRAD